MDDQGRISCKSIIIIQTVGKLTWIYILMTLFDTNLFIKHGIIHIDKHWNEREHVFRKTILYQPNPCYYTPPHFVDILRTATYIILLRLPNFTDYWGHTSPLCSLNPYYNKAWQSTCWCWCTTSLLHPWSTFSNLHWWYFCWYRVTVSLFADRTSLFSRKCHSILTNILNKLSHPKIFF